METKIDPLKIDAGRYARAIELWKEWNGRINVISRRDTDSIFEHHILHSLAIARYLEIFYPSDGVLPPSGVRPSDSPHHPFGAVPPTRGNPGSPKICRFLGCPRGWHVPQGEHSAQTAPSVLDLGCGGGFPGIPLAMEWPEVKFTLCDSIGKKVLVAQSVAEGLGLANVKCVKARVEELPGQWDMVVSRAVAPLETLYGWVRGKFRGSLVCLKGGDVNEEISQLLKRFGKGPDAVRAEQIRAWRISDWLDDEYFAEKFVIEVGKSYLCSPFDEK